MKVRQKWYAVMPDLAYCVSKSDLKSMEPVDFKKEQKIVIELDELEAGYLRSIFLTLGIPVPSSFAHEFSKKLAKLDLPKYNKQYPEWKHLHTYKVYKNLSQPTINEWFPDEWCPAIKPKHKTTAKTEAKHKSRFEWL